MAQTQEPPSERKLKTERLEARITREQKKILSRAAALKGQTFSDFVVNCAYSYATDTIREHEVLTLTGRDREAFVDALLNPKGPGPRLRRAARRFRRR